MPRAFLQFLCLGGLLFIAATSALGAWSAAPSLWFSCPDLCPLRLWHGAIAAASAALLIPTSAKKSQRLRHAQFGLCLLFALWSAIDTGRYWALRSAALVQSTNPLPLSSLLAVHFLCLAALFKAGPGEPWRARWPLRRAVQSCALVLGGGALLLAMILSFGATDYRRPADCAIVLGAKVYADGRMSLALSDRVQEGIALYKQGLADRLIMTGGIDANGQSEARVMAAAAVAAGVPRDHIIIDEYGKNTRASARNCATLCAERGLSTGLVVSHYYHLARCKEAFQRQGLTVYTVPATMSRRLLREPIFLLRECLAYVFYALPQDPRD